MAMRIAHCIYSFNPGGVECFLLALSASLQNEDVETHIFSCYDGPLRKAFEDAGAIIHIIGDIKRYSTYRKLNQFLQESKPDVVNVHITIASGVIGIICKSHHIPFFLYSHSTRVTPIKSSLFASLAVYINLFFAKRLMARGIGVSKDSCRAMWGDFYEKRRARFVNLGINFDGYVPMTERASEEEAGFMRQFHIPPKSFIVANVAGYRPIKNYSFFLQVASEVLKSRQDVFFLLVGEGEERDSLARQMADLGITDNCRLTGYLNTIPALLKTTVDIFLFTSKHEGLGLALVEAQAAGVFCIYSDVVPPEAIINQRIVRPMSLDSSPKEWAKEVLRCIDNGITEIDKKAAYQIALDSDFNIEKTAEEYLRLWQEVVK